MGQNYIKSLFAVGFQGLPHSGVRGDLRRTCPGDRHQRGPHRGRMGRDGLHGAALLYAVQNRQHRKKVSSAHIEEGGKTASKTITLGSLFDGIGVFPLAARLNGIVPLWASEIEAASYFHHQAALPDMTHLGDITKLDGGAIPPVHIPTFGSPCQNLSQIGRREGLTGAKSSLFFQAIRIISEMREATNHLFPVITVWENVMGAFSSNDRMDFRAVLSAFTDAEVPMPPSGRWGNAGMVRGRCTLR